MTDSEKESLQRDKDLWNDVQRIRKNAARCWEEGDSEASWGEMVFSQIFEAALAVPLYCGRVEWRNM
jgi:hypothetical protein